MRRLGVAFAAVAGWFAGSIATQYLLARSTERAYMALSLPLDPEDYEPDERFSITMNPDVPWINGEDMADDLEIILLIREALLNEGVDGEDGDED